MSTYDHNHQNAGGTTAASFRAVNDQTRHCKEDALSDREFEQAVRATYRLDNGYWARECRLILFAAGRLGLRSGEICHLHEDWIDWRNNMIEIPRHETCTLGKDGGICGTCRQAAKQMVAHNEDLDQTTAESLMWGPKTEHSAREIPLDATERAAIAVEEFFEDYDHVAISQGTIARRVTTIAEEAVGLDPETTYPHCLRATAASYWAARGLNAVNLKSLMGWSDFQVAMNYIEASGERTAQSLRALTG
ncbi:site-specific integrase [Halosimplex rubrum]|uniref:Site-specific integrase n=1 Tax=Halosimplex rubrum TaxID=869889 RepID=A0A7D5T545_9EURY|nr:site-specific integrase [Halosimplex rubrum]QLH77449.1 site-specific integrase [Halosimplex rubrum]